MPIYEFKCSKCDEFFELLMLKEEDDAVEMRCPKCKSEEFQRVLSTTSYAMGSSGQPGVSSQTRSCPGGSCTTYDIPGPAR